MKLLLLLLTPGQAGVEAIKGDIAQLSAAHDAAIMAREAKALEKLLDQEFQYINENGEYDKAGYIAGFTDKKLTLDSIKSKVGAIRVLGDVAIETGTSLGEWKVEGKAVRVSARYTSVWVKKGGAWVMTAQQATQETPAEAGGGRAKVPDWQKLTPEQLRRLGEKGEELSKKQAREGFLSEMWMALLGAAVAVVVLIGGIWWRMGGQATAKSAGPSTEDEAKAAAYFDALDKRDRKAGQ